MDAGVRPLATKHQALDPGLSAHVLGQHLVDAHARADSSAGCQPNSSQQIAGHATVNAATASVGVVEPTNERELLLERLDGSQHLAQFHRAVDLLGPPVILRESVAREDAGKSHGRFVRPTRRRFIAPHRNRLQPRQSNTRTQASQHRAA